MTNNERVVIGGVDTHKNVHVAAVIDDRARSSTRPSSPRRALAIASS
jgi:hypothetical protein